MQIISIEDRIARRTKLNEKTGCLEWQGPTIQGYGRLMTGSRRNKTRKLIAAHRFIYEKHYGKIPPGLYVCHRCDNRRCVNHVHLFLGTHSDNMKDMASKGRGTKSGLKGENHPNAKLTAKKVAEIRAMKNRVPTQKISAMYGVAFTTIRNILNNHTWKEGSPLPEPPKEEK